MAQAIPGHANGPVPQALLADPTDSRQVSGQVGAAKFFTSDLHSLFALQCWPPSVRHKDKKSRD